MNSELEISQQAFEALDARDVLLIDMRSALSTAYGMIPGALALPAERIADDIFRTEKKLG